MLPIILTLTLSAEPTLPLSPAEVFKVASPSVVVVGAVDENMAAQGSGIAFGRRLIVTNFHVVRAAKSLAVKGPNGVVLRATLIAEDELNDLALLRVWGGEFVPVSVRTRDVRVGDRVFAVGAPEGLELTLSEGLISGLRQVNSRKLIQTSAAISHGSSGGGLFDQYGQLVGITTAVIADAQNLNFAVPARLAAEIVKSPFSVRGRSLWCGLSAPERTALTAELTAIEAKQFSALCVGQQPPSAVMNGDAPVATRSMSPPQPGWESLRWGMSVGEVDSELIRKGVLRARQRCQLEADGTCTLTSHAYEVSGISPAIFLGFKEGRLESVSLSVYADRSPPNPDTQFEAFVRLRKSVEATYGAPTTAGPIDDFLSRKGVGGACSWDANRTRIDLSSMSKPKSGVIDILLSFSECATCEVPLSVELPPSSDADREFESRIFSREAWLRTEWTRLGEDHAFRQFEDSTSKEAMFNAKLLRSGQRRLGSRLVNVAMLKRFGEESPPLGMMIYDSEDKRQKPLGPKDCKALMTKLETAFGVSPVKQERPMTTDVFNGVTVRAQWDVGDARLGFSCLGLEFTTGERQGVMNLSAWHRTTEEADPGLRWIRCSQVVTVTGYGESHEAKAAPPVFFAIDDFKSKALFRDNYIPIEAPSISETSITFTRESPKRTDTVRIDRVTGQYSETRVVKDAPVTAVVTGQCEKADVGAVKF